MSPPSSDRGTLFTMIPETAVRKIADALTAAVDRAGAASPVAEVERALRELAGAGDLVLPDRLARPCADRYARHLVHRDPAGRFTVLAMVWGPGQGTPLHDHDGLWGVECVAAGEIEAEAYRHVGHDEEGADRFELLAVDRGGVGATGTLEPPLEYHVMRNPRSDSRAVTVHVYGGELTRCRVFHPLGGDRYRPEARTLTLDD